MKHTPGPWKLCTETTLNQERDGSDITWLTITAPRDKPIISQKVYGSPPEEQLANARLIAKAPEMYDELIRLCQDKAELLEVLKESELIIANKVKHIKETHGHPKDLNVIMKVLEKIQAVIAKARKES